MSHTAILTCLESARDHHANQRLTARYAFSIHASQGIVQLLPHCRSTTSAIIGNRPVGSPDVNQLLHWLEITVREQSEEFAHTDEEAEARMEVHGVRLVDVPEGIDEV